MSTYKRIGPVAMTCDILNLLSDQKEPISAADIAKSLEMNINTAYCYLYTLLDEKYVSIVGGHFQLGDAAALLWARRKAALQWQSQKIAETLEKLS